MKQYVLVLLIAVFLSISSLGIGASVIDSASQIGEGSEITIGGNDERETTGEEKSEIVENDVPTCPLYGDVTLFKYWDVNENGEYDQGDEPIENWYFEIYQHDECWNPGPRGGEEEILSNPWYLIDEGWTDSDGYLEFEIECNDHYKVREYLDHGEEEWYFTGGTVIGGSEDGADYDDFEIIDGYVDISFWDRCEDVEIWFGNAKEEVFGDITVHKFHDENYDGEWNDDEQLIDGFDFQLWYADEDGNPIPDGEIGDPVSTVEGIYTFEDLELGNYVVQEIKPEVGEEECCWASTTGLLQHVEVYDDETYNLHFGNVRGGSIEGMKFLDIEADGNFDLGLDKPLMDWEIYLWTNVDGEPGEKIATTTTDRSGDFYFDCVAPGEYFVEEEMYEGWYNVKPDVVPVYVESCETSEKIEFANCMYKDIYGIKYFDSQQTGYFDQRNDWVLGGWPIQLLNEDEEVIQTTETQPNGYYFFEGLTVGTYYVEELLPEDEDPEAWINTTESKVEVVMTCCNSCTLVNFGNYKYPEITIVKYNDANMNMNYDVDEELVIDSVWFDIFGDLGSGITVEYNLEVFGEWSWYVDEGTYVITENLPTGWHNTTALEQMVSLKAAEEVTVEFGNVQYGHIEVCKFYDTNMNSELDDEEEMLPGWEFNLWTTNEDGSLGEIIRTNETGGCGCYTFEDLLPGTYAVEEIEQDCWFPTTDLIQYVEVEAGLTGEVWFGNVPGGSIDGYKFCDYNMNQEFDEIEYGLEGWTINLYEYEENEEAPMDGHLYMSTVTDEDGYYEFECVEPGMYILEEEMQEDWYASTPESYTIGVEPEDELSYNFGNYRYGDITGIKFYDFDMNSEFDPEVGDIPLRGRTVELWEADVQGNKIGTEPIDSTETDAHGYYSFEDVGPGDYVVYQPKACCEWYHTTPREVHVRMGCLEEREVNFGEYTLSSIDVYVIGETGVDVKIYESNENGDEVDMIESGVTGDHGWYISEDLEPGYYLVKIEGGQTELVQLRMGEQVEFEYEYTSQNPSFEEAIYARFERK